MHLKWAEWPAANAGLLHFAIAGAQSSRITGIEAMQTGKKYGVFSGTNHALKQAMDTHFLYRSIPE